MKQELSFVQDENENLRTNLAGQKTENSELVAEIERYAEVIDQLKSEVATLKETLRNKQGISKARAPIEKKVVPKKPASNEDLFMAKSIGSADDVCAALSSFVRNHSNISSISNISFSDIPAWFEDKPAATATIEVKEPMVSKTAANADTWGFNESKASPPPESPINPENLISMLFVSFDILLIINVLFVFSE